MLRTVGVAFKTVARSTVRHSSQCGVNPLLATQAKQSILSSHTSNTAITPSNAVFAPIKSEPIFKSKFQLNEANPIPARFLITWENTINNYNKEENPQNNIEYQMESVKRKRKRKMNKHKLRKRRKAQKALMKKLGRA